jgi:hypothetical protein
MRPEDIVLAAGDKCVSVILDQLLIPHHPHHRPLFYLDFDPVLFE